jgi:hypothetical protein
MSRSGKAAGLGGQEGFGILLRRGEIPARLPRPQDAEHGGDVERPQHEEAKQEDPEESLCWFHHLFPLTYIVPIEHRILNIEHRT